MKYVSSITCFCRLFMHVSVYMLEYHKLKFNPFDNRRSTAFEKPTALFSILKMCLLSLSIFIFGLNVRKML